MTRPRGTLFRSGFVQEASHRARIEVTMHSSHPAHHQVGGESRFETGHRRLERGRIRERRIAVENGLGSRAGLRDQIAIVDRIEQPKAREPVLVRAEERPRTAGGEIELTHPESVLRTSEGLEAGPDLGVEIVVDEEDRMRR